jgi:hypothetical protein
VTTVTSTVPESVGAVAVIDVGERTVKFEDALAPNRTALTCANPLPVMTTLAPPPADTVDGVSDVTVGASGLVTAVVGVEPTRRRGLSGEPVAMNAEGRPSCGAAAMAEELALSRRSAPWGPIALDVSVVVKTGRLDPDNCEADAVPADATADLDQSRAMNVVRRQTPTIRTA